MTLNNDLITAIRECNINKVERLIDSGADINACHKLLGSPLINALYQKNITLLTLLVDKGVELNIVDRFNISPLEVAIKLGFREALSLLILKGAKLHSNANAFYTRNLINHHKNDLKMQKSKDLNLKRVS